MAAINQNGGQNVTIVVIVISPILMIFQAFVIFPISRSSNLIFWNSIWWLKSDLSSEAVLNGCSFGCRADVQEEFEW